MHNTDGQKACIYLSTHSFEPQIVPGACLVEGTADGCGPDGQQIIRTVGDDPDPVGQQ